MARKLFVVLLLAVLLGACTGAQTATTLIAGGTVRVVGVWGGAERESFFAMVKPFEERTGIKVEYTGTRDLNALLWRGIARKELPDVAGIPGPGQMAEFAQVGALRDLTGVVDVARYKAETVPAFVDLGTVDGKLVGVFIRANVKGLMWFNPKVYALGPASTYEELLRKANQAARGQTKRWCIGLESGEASGWPATDWIEDILLRQSGPDIYSDWVAGKVKWTSPEVRKAFESFGAVVSPAAAFGGTERILATNFGEAGNPLFADPPGCVFHHQASFMTEFFRREAGARADEIDFFPFPTIDPRYEGAVIGAGDLFGMFNDTPQAREFMKYLVTPEAQSLWVSRGGALSGNSKVTEYPDDLSRRAANVLLNAKVFRFDASDMMPEAMNDAFWSATLDFTRDQNRLDDILNRLDAVQARAYTQ